MQEKRLLNALSRNEVLAATDPLTGLYNRRQFNAELEHHWANWRQHGIPVSLLLIDGDDFGLINKVHGHQAGDAVLIAIADTIRSECRDGDCGARVGGDEAAIILAGTDGHINAAKRLRKALMGEITHLGREIHYSCSVGSASSKEIGRSQSNPDALYQLADERLRAEKRAIKCIINP